MTTHIAGEEKDFWHTIPQVRYLVRRCEPSMEQITAYSLFRAVTKVQAKRELSNYKRFLQVRVLDGYESPVWIDVPEVEEILECDYDPESDPYNPDNASL